MRKNIERFLFYLFIILTLVSCKDVPLADKFGKKGIITFTDDDLKKDSIFILKGEVEFYWNQLLFSEDFKKADSLKIIPNYINLFGDWHYGAANYDSLSQQGFATIRFVVHFEKEYNVFALQALPPLTASRLFINGEEALTIGQVGKNADLSIPRYEKKLITFHSDTSAAEFIYQVSNFHHAYGGVQHFLRLSKPAVLYRSNTLNLIVNTFFLGSILVMALYHFVLYFMWKKSRSALFFAILSLLIFFRIFVADNHFETYFFNIPWRWVIFIELASFILAIPVFYFYFDSIFKTVIPKSSLVIIGIITGFFLFSFLLIQPIIYLRYVNLVLAWVVVNIVHLSVRIFFSEYRKMEFSGIFAVGILFFVLTIINDILQNRSFIETKYAVHVGLFVFLFSQVYLLSKKFSQAFLTSENLTKELWFVNENLEKTILERTQEIRSQKDKIEKQSGEITLAYAKLSETEQFKEDLVNMIVHDLKNPLNVLLNLPKDVFVNGAYEKVKRSSQIMQNLVLNMLDVRKYQDCKMNLQYEELCLNEQIEEAIEEILFLKEEKNIEIEIKNTLKYTVFSDKNLLFRVLVNLLTNAIKYSFANAKVEMRVEEIGDNVLKVYVKDYGEGIDETQQLKVFEKFGQIASKDMGKLKATGLGLTFCKLAIEQQGRKIGVNSKLGKGAEFWFTLEKLKNKATAAEPLAFHKHKHLKFTTCEMEFLAPYVVDINKIEIYNFSEINSVLATIPENTQTITLWKNKLRNAILSQNENLFHDLLGK